MSRVIFINRYFYPDHSATSRLLSDLAFELATDGFEVCVISSRQRYDNSRERLPRRETVRSVSIQRVGGTRFGRFNLVGRALDYATFLVAVGWRLWRHARAGDVVIFKTDPPMLGPALAPVARLRRALVVNWLQDLFPQVAIEAGVIGPRTGAALTRFCTRALRAADHCVCVGDSMAGRLREAGVDASVIDNWVDIDALVARPQAVATLRDEWQIGDRFVIAYSGNLGRAHPVAALKEAILTLSDSRRHLFLFTGGGVGYEALERWSVARDLDTVMFRPYQPEARLPALLALGDVHLAVLAPEFEGLIVPSKFSGISAAGRACLFIGSDRGQIASWINQANCGRVVSDGKQLAQAIADLMTDLPATREMGERAQVLARQTFARPLAMQRWRQALQQVGANNSSEAGQID